MTSSPLLLVKYIFFKKPNICIQLITYFDLMQKKREEKKEGEGRERIEKKERRALERAS